MAVTRVRLFGLVIASEFALPGLLPASANDAADVTIRCEALGARANLSIEPGLAFLVEDGASIVIDADPSTPLENIRLYLLGSAFGLLLHQRGLLPLHANAVDLGGRAIAVAGVSGAGKSTLAAWFHDRGLPLIGDDVCVVRRTDEGAIAYPGVPRLRLWGQAIEATGRSRDGLARAYAGDDSFDKWEVPLGAGGAVGEGVKLAAIYVLEDGDDFEILPLTGVDAADALFAHTYRGEYVEAIGGGEAHWRGVLGLMGAVATFRLIRPFELSRREELGRVLLDHAMAQVVRTSGADRSAPPG